MAAPTCRCRCGIFDVLLKMPAGDPGSSKVVLATLSTVAAREAVPLIHRPLIVPFASGSLDERLGTIFSGSESSWKAPASDGVEYLYFWSTIRFGPTRYVVDGPYFLPFPSERTTSTTPYRSPPGACKLLITDGIGRSASVARKSPTGDLSPRLLKPSRSASRLSCVAIALHLFSGSCISSAARVSAFLGDPSGF